MIKKTSQSILIRLDNWETPLTIELNNLKTPLKKPHVTNFARLDVF